MGDWPLHGIGQALLLNRVAGQTYCTAIGTTTANTKSAWVVLIASTTIPCSFLMLIATLGNTNQSFLIDIAIGATGSEKIIINNLLVSFGNASEPLPCYFAIPLSLPVGVQISARAQSSGTTNEVRLCAYIMSEQFTAPSAFNKVLTYGANIADSGGTSIDPGATANAKGSWVELVSSCDALSGIVMAVGGQANGSRSFTFWMIDIGIGGEGSEVIIVPDLFVMSVIYNALMPIYSPFIPLRIKSGTRIVARAQCYSNSSPNRLIDVALYGIQ